MKFRSILSMAVVGASLGLTALCQAQVYNTPTGSTAGGQPVNAMATFTVSNGMVHVVLVNNQANPTSVVQNLSDLGFTVSSGLTNGSLTGSAGLERTIAGNGTYTDGAVVATGWVLDHTGAPFHLNDLGTGAVGPEHTLIGAPGGSNVYNNANGGIAGNNAHNPFLAGPVTFDISIPGLTANDYVNSAFFSFGTTSGVNVTGVRTGGGGPNGNVPEPGSIAMLTGMGIGGSLFAFARLRRRRK